LYNKLGFTGVSREIDNWFKIPNSKSNLLAFHGEKKSDVMHKMIEELENVAKDSIKVLFLAPHLSTGGMPAFLLKRIQTLLEFSNLQIIVVEYSNHSDHYVVQKNQIKQLAHHIYTLGEDKLELMDIINRHAVDVVHVEEMVEDGHNNWPESLRQALYTADRTWRVVETCHNIIFKPDIEKRYHPDAYAFCTPYHLETFKNMPSRKEVIEFPIEKKHSAPIDLGAGVHVLNVGLWTPGKNQGEAVELARQMPDVHFHFVGNQAGNFQSYWEPIMKDLPPNVHVWGERDDVGSFMKGCDVFMFNSTFECNPLVLREAIGYGKPILARNLPQYRDMFTQYITDLKPEKMKEQLYELLRSDVTYTIPEGQTSEFAKKHIDLYKDVINRPIQPDKELINITHTFVNEPFLEITGNSKSVFTVRFYDEQGVCHYKNQIRVNHWVKLNRRWFTKWTIKVWKDDELYYEYTLNYENQRVYIAFDSSSLGDTIAWIPHVLEFKKKHNCHVIVSTFKNFLFQDVYPELEFVKPGTPVINILGMYSIGWFYNADKEPTLCNTIPLQKAATNILGLDYQEIRPRISFTPDDNLYGKYITIATNSTAGCKFWTKEGWQHVINFLYEKGYKVINVSKEKNPFDNCEQIEDASMENTMNVIHHSHLFIGLSSGLSWLAWALNKKVVMISNFTDADHEFQCIRIDKKDVCNGCWNKAEYRFDAGDWDWCPVHKGTDRQFECHKKIDASQVVFALLSHI
jgi:autotransporter strand-loop-strand O-heptosyltransferase